jgi:hypothetical protein
VQNTSDTPKVAFAVLNDLMDFRPGVSVLPDAKPLTHTRQAEDSIDDPRCASVPARSSCSWKASSSGSSGHQTPRACAPGRSPVHVSGCASC